MTQTKITILLVLILLSAFFSGVETALFSLSRLRVKHLVRKKVRGARAVERLKDQPHKLLITILIGNNLVNIGASALATSIIFEISRSYAVSITTGIMTLIILVFGEITPKTLATKHSEQISLIVAKPLQLLQTVLSPVIFVFEGLTNALTNLSGQKPKPLVTEDEIETFVTVAEEAGQIKDVEKKMIHRIFRLDDLEAKDVMTPRNKIVAVSADDKFKSIAEVFHTKGYARLPVYKENLDHIKGFVHVMDAQEAMLQRENALVGTIVRPILFVPESKKLDSLLKYFQRRKQHIAIVVDDFGTNVGLVTLEDVLEEIVGEIIDETEKIGPTIKRLSSRSFLVQGRADIDEINEKCGLDLPEEKAPYSISSYILDKIGRIPKEGDIIRQPKFEIKIKSMEGNSINTVIITRRK
ncbi:MAG: hemolysin family protein [Candidatus Zixiibacteriota bacterium]|jgi:putative hemolysin